MNKSFLAALVLSTVVWAPAAYASAASSCHFHGFKPAAESVITGCADQRKQTLIKDGKLDASWADVKTEKVEIIDGKRDKEWKLAFKNPAVSEVSNQTLYMYYSLSGNFIAANFTGQ